LAVAFVVIAPLAIASGCAQGQGERCQVQSDCATGLQCVLPAGGTPQAGGTCQPLADAGTFGPDMSVVDMAAHGD
jgi:hypothetical protein